jgi:hypothetical protein
MYFVFYLDDIEIEEPQGFADIVLNMKRDDNWHGVFFEASTSELAFYGIAAAYLKNKKETAGLKSDVTFKAMQACGIYDELETILEGKLDFGKYSESCGNVCMVRIPVEQTGCIMTLRNRYDQKVDLDAIVTFNKLSALQQYTELGQTISLPAVALQSAIDGSVADAGYPLTTTTTIPGVATLIMFYRPDYEVERYNNILTGQLIGINNCEHVAGAIATSCEDAITPQLLFEDDIKCFDGNFSYSSRMKGIISWAANLKLYSLAQKIIKWDATGNIYTDGEVVSEGIIFFDDINPLDGPDSYSFDNTVSGIVTIPDGTGLYAVLEPAFIGSSGNSQIDVQFDKETYFTLEATKLCPATDVEYYMIHESLSRITESITDNCLKAKSDYYGRTDSQPYNSNEDGCGSLRFLTSGLKIRRATNPAFFASLKDIFEGLRGIDNIGMGIEPNPYIPGYSWLRIEPVEYFYTDTEILSLPFVPFADINTQEQLHYSLIKTGYQKWEVEQVNGLDEPNSNREYRTILTSVNNTLDITSKLVAGSYAIETTRQQSFADTGAADTSYDNETFIICVERQAYSFQIERGIIDNAANIFSPQTLYNWRIRPYYNLMRWFKSIANSYPNISDTDNRLYFSSGTGNFLAEGQIGGAYPTCKLENGVKAENRDLSRLDFIDPDEATPLWKPDYAAFKYPLSVADYKAIKANPYGYISFQCGTGEWKKGYIQDIKYRLNKGEADFTLKLKYQ